MKKLNSIFSIFILNCHNIKNCKLLFSLCVIFFLSIFNNSNSYAQRFNEIQLLDGLDSLIAFSIDTTGHWWAVTSPFSNKYRIIIDNQEGPVIDDSQSLVFAPGGLGWSYICNINNSIYLVDEIGETYLEKATDMGEVFYSPDGTQRAFSYFIENIENIILPFRKIEVQNRKSDLFIDNTGKSFAFTANRLNKFVININGWESSLYDEIIPIGFWHTGEFIYAVRNGSIWDIMQGKKTLGESFAKIIDAKININGTVCAVLVQLNTGKCMSIMYAEEYLDPIYGKNYNDVWGLALHPIYPLIGFVATDASNKTYVVQNSTEYFTEGKLSAPYYSYDGEELIFIDEGNFNPYININGRRNAVYLNMDAETVIAKKSKSPTFAYSTATTLLVQYYETNKYYTGYMTDNTCETIWNWRTGEYQTLGEIRNRLYLITCKP